MESTNPASAPQNIRLEKEDLAISKVLGEGNFGIALLCEYKGNEQSIKNLCVQDDDGNYYCVVKLPKNQRGKLIKQDSQNISVATLLDKKITNQKVISNFETEGNNITEISRPFLDSPHASPYNIGAKAYYGNTPVIISRPEILYFENINGKQTPIFFGDMNRFWNEMSEHCSELGDEERKTFNPVHLAIMDVFRDNREAAINRFFSSMYQSIKSIHDIGKHCHRDVALRNFMPRVDLRSAAHDYGLASSFNAAGYAKMLLNKDEAPIRYLDTEGLANKSSIKTDLYGLKICFFEMLAKEMGLSSYQQIVYLTNYPEPNKVFAPARVKMTDEDALRTYFANAQSILKKCDKATQEKVGLMLTCYQDYLTKMPQIPVEELRNEDEKLKLACETRFFVNYIGKKLYGLGIPLDKAGADKFVTAIKLVMNNPVNPDDAAAQKLKLLCNSIVEHADNKNYAAINTIINDNQVDFLKPYLYAMGVNDFKNCFKMPSGENRDAKIQELLNDPAKCVVIINFHEQGTTFLHSACVFAADKQLEFMAELIRHGADVTIKDSAGKTAFESANNDLKKAMFYEKMAYFLHKGDINDSDRTQLNYMLQSNTYIKELIKIDKDGAGNTLLHNLIIDGQTQILRELLANGVNVDIQNGAGESLLFTAAKLGNSEVVKLLLQYGANTAIGSPFDATENPDIREAIVRHDNQPVITNFPNVPFQEKVKLYIDETHTLSRDANREKKYFLNSILFPELVNDVVKIVHNSDSVNSKRLPDIFKHLDNDRKSHLLLSLITKKLPTFAEKLFSLLSSQDKNEVILLMDKNKHLIPEYDTKSFQAFISRLNTNDKFAMLKNPDLCVSTSGVAVFQNMNTKDQISILRHHSLHVTNTDKTHISLFSSINPQQQSTDITAMIKKPFFAKGSRVAAALINGINVEQQTELFRELAKGDQVAQSILKKLFFSMNREQNLILLKYLIVNKKDYQLSQHLFASLTDDPRRLNQRQERLLLSDTTAFDKAGLFSALSAEQKQQFLKENKDYFATLQHTQAYNIAHIFSIDKDLAKKVFSKQTNLKEQTEILEVLLTGNINKLIPAGIKPPVNPENRLPYFINCATSCFLALDPDRQSLIISTIIQNKSALSEDPLKLMMDRLSREEQASLIHKLVTHAPSHADVAADLINCITNPAVAGSLLNRLKPGTAATIVQDDKINDKNISSAINSKGSNSNTILKELTSEQMERILENIKPDVKLKYSQTIAQASKSEVVTTDLRGSKKH